MLDCSHLLALGRWVQQSLIKNVGQTCIARSLVLRAGFRAGLAGLNLGYPENPALKSRKPS